MRERLKIWGRILLVAAVTVPFLSGCVAIVAAGAGAGAYAYFKGGLESHISAPVETAIPAVRRAANQLALIKIKEVSDSTSAEFTFRDSLDIRISIELVQKQKNLTQVEIRVGRVGDENRSLQILNTINSQL